MKQRIQNTNNSQTIQTQVNQGFLKLRHKLLAGFLMLIMIPYLVGCESNTHTVYPKSSVVSTGDLYTDALNYIKDFRKIYNLNSRDKISDMKEQVNAYVGQDISPLLDEVTHFVGQSKEEQDRYILSQHVISQGELDRIYTLGEEISSLGFEKAVEIFSNEVFSKNNSAQQLSFYNNFVTMLKVVYSLNPQIFASPTWMWGKEAKFVAGVIATVGGVLLIASGMPYHGAAAIAFGAWQFMELF